MAGNSANVRIIFSGDTTALNHSLSAAQRKLKATESAFSAIATTMATVFSAQAIGGGIGLALNAIDDYKRKTLSIATVLSDTVKGSSEDIQQAFQQNKRHADAMFKLFQKQAAKSLSTVNDLLDAYQVFTSRGLSLKADEKSVSSLAAVIDRINIATEGQQNQVMQEMRAMLEGRARPSDVTARIFTARDANFQQNIKLLAQSGNGKAVIDYIGTLISDIPLGDEISKLLSKQRQNVKTAIQIWALDAFQPLYNTISEYLGKVAESLNSGNNPLARGLETLMLFLNKILKVVVDLGTKVASNPFVKFIAEASPKILALAGAFLAVNTALSGVGKLLTMQVKQLMSWQTAVLAFYGAIIAMNQYVDSTVENMAKGTASVKSVNTAKFYQEIIVLVENVTIILREGFFSIINSMNSAVEWIVESVTNIVRSTNEEDNNKEQLRKISDWRFKALNGWSVTDNYKRVEAVDAAMKLKGNAVNDADFISAVKSMRAAKVPEDIIAAVANVRTYVPEKQSKGLSGAEYGFWQRAEEAMRNNRSKHFDFSSTEYISGQSNKAAQEYLEKSQEEIEALKGLTIAQIDNTDAVTAAKETISERISPEENYIRSMKADEALFGPGFKGGMVEQGMNAPSNYQIGATLAQEMTTAGRSAISDALYNAILGEGGFKDVLVGFGQNTLRAITDTISQQIMKLVVSGIAELIVSKSKEVIVTEMSTAARETEGVVTADAATKVAALGASALSASAALNSLSASTTASAASGVLSSVVVAGATGSANGNVLVGGFKAFANGGTVSSPTLGLIGEGRYNEAVVPLPDGRTIPVVMRGNGEGMTVNIYNNSSSDVYAEESQDDFGNRILEVVIDAANRNKRGFRTNMRSLIGAR